MERSYKIPNRDRLCIKCGKGEDLTVFGKGKAGVCNRCSKIMWETENPVKLRAQRLYGNAQKRSRVNGWPPPDFSSVWIEEKILAGFCEATGIPFEFGRVGNGVHAENPWVPSIDRIDSSGPYIKDNVQIVVYMYNVCKSEFTHEDVVRFCKMFVAEEKNAI